jgi:hypothetical protein
MCVLMLFMVAPELSQIQVCLITKAHFSKHLRIYTQSTMRASYVYMQIHEFRFHFWQTTHVTYGSKRPRSLLICLFYMGICGLITVTLLVFRIKPAE